MPLCEEILMSRMINHAKKDDMTDVQMEAID